jgi:hypothetical protein
MGWIWDQIRSFTSPRVEICGDHEECSGTLQPHQQPSSKAHTATNVTQKPPKTVSWITQKHQKKMEWCQKSATVDPQPNIFFDPSTANETACSSATLVMPTLQRRASMASKSCGSGDGSIALLVKQQSTPPKKKMWWLTYCFSHFSNKKTGVGMVCQIGSPVASRWMIQVARHRNGFSGQKLDLSPWT